jgi:hypothetical protein
MEINDLKTKIDYVKVRAQILVRQYRHTEKFAKHIVALAVKQLKGILTDAKLVEFLPVDPLGKWIGYDHRPDPTTFSKVRERCSPGILET